jgi:hypothetical protein
MSKHRHPRRPIRTFVFTVLLAAWCAGATPAAAQSTQPENKQSDSVHGIVVNSVTREPIGRALVERRGVNRPTFESSTRRHQMAGVGLHDQPDFAARLELEGIAGGQG